MDNNKNGRINQILAHLASAATTAADGVSEAVQSASSAVSDKYNGVKLSIELNRLQDEQVKLFSDIGRTMYVIKAGKATEQTTEDGEVIDAQATVDRLLDLAEDKQNDIDAVAEKIQSLSGEKLCSVCGKVASGDDHYCSKCGSKLSD